MMIRWFLAAIVRDTDKTRPNELLYIGASDIKIPHWSNRSNMYGFQYSEIWYLNDYIDKYEYLFFFTK